MPQKRFLSKVVLVTGASRGIGRAVAQAFAEEGAKIALLARTLEPMEKLADELNRRERRAIAIRCDIRVKSDVEQAMAELARTWGRLHVLVNNAGVSGRTPMDDPSDERWHDILDTNLNGTHFVTKSALELMSSGWGRIINMSSVLGRFGVPGYAAYCTAKHGLLGFTRALALELASRQITVNALCPGWVSTDMAERGIRESSEAMGISVQAFRDDAIDAVPLKRFIEPEEVAKLVLYLASDDASGITGQTYNLCGGQTMD